MADDSDEENRKKNRIENQPYDETLEVPDAEEVASIYTPTPRHPKNRSSHSNNNNNNSSSNYNLNQSASLQKFNRTTPPPTETSFSSSNSNNKYSNQRDPRRSYRGDGSRMSDRSQSEITPKENDHMRNQHDTDESESEGNDSGDDSRDNFNDMQAGYDPAAFRDLPVNSEIRDIFKYIEKYQPQNLQLDFKLKPFIPDYIPSIGDIDAFIKIPRPDGKPDNLGFTVVDEPSSNQSDPHVLDLYFRSLSKQSTEMKQPSAVKSVESGQTKAIDSWIKNISALQKNKPVQTVNYQRAMPDIERLMQAWPPEFEDLLKEVSLPSPELNVDLNTYIDIICALLDIPVYKSRVQSLHVLFTLFSEFKNSEHFKAPSAGYKTSQSYDGGKKSGKHHDKLVIE